MTPALPEWLTPGYDAAPATLVYSTHRQRLVRRSLASLMGVLQALVGGTNGATTRGLVQAADVRARILALLALIVVATVLRHPLSLAAALAVAVVLATASHVPARRLLATLAVAPLLATLVVLPATLNVVSGGYPILTLWHGAGGRFGPWHLPALVAVTDTGVLVAARLVLRTAACVTFALCLAAGSRPAELLHGLAALGVPSSFVMVLAMTERYLVVLVRAAEQIHLARLARSLGGSGLGREQAWAAAGMAEVFRKSRALADGVTLAMISRGFTGEVRARRATGWRWRDGLYLIAAAAVGAGLIALDRVLP